MKYIKLLDGIKSNANGFEYKIGEVNVANNWNPKTMEPELMVGFSFSVEDKIIRWIHRGDTAYDVEIPEDAEVIDCSGPSCPNGVFRSNKIILSNPRKLNEEMVMDFYKKSNLPQKTYYHCIVVALHRSYLNVAKQIIKDKVNKENINDCINEFESFITEKRDGLKHEFKYNDLWPEAKLIYDLLLELKEKYDKD